MTTNFQLILILIALTFLFACRQKNVQENAIQKEEQTEVSQSLALDTFSEFPPEIDGCSCYFSNDSSEFTNGKYIYVNDYAQLAFLKLNGSLVKFTQTDFKESGKGNTSATYKSENYSMTIEAKDGIQNGDETWLKTGTITVTTKDGKTLTKTFYGECGC